MPDTTFDITEYTKFQESYRQSGTLPSTEDDNFTGVYRESTGANEFFFKSSDGPINRFYDDLQGSGFVTETMTTQQGSLMKAVVNKNGKTFIFTARGDRVYCISEGSPGSGFKNQDPVMVDGAYPSNTKEVIDIDVKLIQGYLYLIALVETTDNKIYLLYNMDFENGGKFSKNDYNDVKGRKCSISGNGDRDYVSDWKIFVTIINPDIEVYEYRNPPFYSAYFSKLGSISSYCNTSKGFKTFFRPEKDIILLFYIDESSRLVSRYVNMLFSAIGNTVSFPIEATVLSAQKRKFDILYEDSSKLKLVSLGNDKKLYSATFTPLNMYSDEKCIQKNVKNFALSASQNPTLLLLDTNGKSVVYQTYDTTYGTWNLVDIKREEPDKPFVRYFSYSSEIYFHKGDEEFYTDMDVTIKSKTRSRVEINSKIYYTSPNIPIKTTTDYRGCLSIVQEAPAFGVPDLYITPHPKSFEYKGQDFKLSQTQAIFHKFQGITVDELLNAKTMNGVKVIKDGTDKNDLDTIVSHINTCFDYVNDIKIIGREDFEYPAEQSSALGDLIGDFLLSAINGVIDLSSKVIDIVLLPNTGIQIIVDGISYIASTVYEIFYFIKALLTTVITSFAHFCEWVADIILNWDNILEVKNIIAHCIEEQLNGFGIVSNKFLDKLDQGFDAAKNNIDHALTYIEKYSSSSLEDIFGSKNKPSLSQKQKLAVSNNFLLNKLINDKSDAKNVINLINSKDFEKNIKEELASCEELLIKFGTSLQDTKGVKDAIDHFKYMLSKGKPFLRETVKAVFNIILQCVKLLLLNPVLEFARLVLNLSGVLTSPLLQALKRDTDIPFVTSFYRFVTGQPQANVSYLEMVALTMALGSHATYGTMGGGQLLPTPEARNAFRTSASIQKFIDMLDSPMWDSNDKNVTSIKFPSNVQFNGSFSEGQIKSCLATFSLIGSTYYYMSSLAADMLSVDNFSSTAITAIALCSESLWTFCSTPWYGVSTGWDISNCVLGWAGVGLDSLSFICDGLNKGKLAENAGDPWCTITVIYGGICLFSGIMSLFKASTGITGSTATLTLGPAAICISKITLHPAVSKIPVASLAGFSFGSVVSTLIVAFLTLDLSDIIKANKPPTLSIEQEI